MPPKEKCCRNPNCKIFFRQYNSLQRYCSYQCELAHKGRPKSINPVSPKRKKEIPVYSKLREEFLSQPENQLCFIEGCYNPAESVEHRAGRKGYADQWARENKITLYLDVRFWAPCCLSCNLELERNPELSKQYQLSKLHKGKKI